MKITVLGAEQTNTSIVFGERFILKLFRRLEPGENPELEIGRFLTAQGFPHIPWVEGALTYQEKESRMTLGILQRYIPNQGNAWEYTLKMLRTYYQEAMARPQNGEREEISREKEHLLDRLEEDPGPLARERMGDYLEAIRLLGQRTAELHLALSSGVQNPDFAPEPFTQLYQRSLYQSMRGLTGQVFDLLRRNLERLPQEARLEAEALLAVEALVIDFFRRILDRKITGLRIRCHGDYHLGQVLFTGRDFVIMDFEGEPARPIGERRLKRSPLRDVAGMLRSFHYVSQTALPSADTPSDPAFMGLMADGWRDWAGRMFLASYLKTLEGSHLLPRSREEVKLLLDLFLLEKGIYELGYEINNRPDWVRIPLKGIGELLSNR